ncbi:MAG: hypothetical protein K6E29_05460 [Cyanobacteria bacterium RUI128]|nr:hypothetical protein [Cyanobacteria bacterium RUI128]
MGMSSSQARLLTLTSRMHQIEYKAAKLEAQKLQMANESRRAYEEYLVALDQTKVQLKTINNTGSFDYIDATYNNLIAAGYKIDFIGDVEPGISAELLQPIEQITDPSHIPAGYTAINSVQDLKNINNNLSGKYILMCDLDLSGENWTPIRSSFSGILNGNGHVIKNLSSNTGGLFNRLMQGTVRNLGICNANISGTTVGVLSNFAYNSHIYNCYVTNSTLRTSNGPAGGLVGSLTQYSTIENCYSDVSITSPIPYQLNNAGYIFGYAHGSGAINSYYVNNGSNIRNGGHTGSVQEVTRGELNSIIPSSGIEYISDYQNSTEWLTNMITAGAIIISKPDSKGNFFETSVAIDTDLQEVSDEALLRKAEAKYEADMRKIDKKDRLYDHELAALDNERNAIKSEMETLKTVAKDNVERTFKLFS